MIFSAKTICAIIAALTFTTPLAEADIIEFKNGDRISGNILSIVDGTVKINTTVAGEVKVKLSDIKTFQTDSPVELHLPDGTVMQKLIQSDESGQVKLSDKSDSSVEKFAIKNIKAVNPPKPQWEVSISVGAAATRGNSNGESLNLNVEAVRDAKNDRVKFNGAYDFSRREDPDTEKDKTTQDKWTGFGQYDHFFSERFYSYINTRVTKDRLADLDVRFTPGGGGGFQWLRTPTLQLSSEAGVSYVHENYRNPDDKEDYTAARAAYDFSYKLNGHAKFFHSLEYLPSTKEAKTFLLNTDAGLKVKINSHLFTEFKVLFNYNSQPGDEDEKLDTKYIANIGVNF